MVKRSGLAGCVVLLAVVLVMLLTIAIAVAITVAITVAIAIFGIAATLRVGVVGNQTSYLDVDALQTFAQVFENWLAQFFEHGNEQKRYLIGVGCNEQRVRDRHDGRAILNGGMDPRV